MSSLGRPPVKKLLVEHTLRERMVSGNLLPGARVPTRRDLAEEFKATLNTVQQALASLERDGFVKARGRQGTFVTNKPPHLNHFALVFPFEPESGNWGLYWDHLAVVARRVIKDQGLRLTIYTGVNKHNPGKDYEQLLADLRADRLAGIMFSTSPYEVTGTDILDKPGIPRVVLGAAAARSHSMGCVDLDGPGFVTRAVDFLKRRGITSVALLQQPGRDTESLLTRLKKAGLACPYQFQQAVPLSCIAWARNSMRMLFDVGHAARPEALIVLDDNLFAPAVSGILDAGLQIPRDLTILTHSNFPWQDPCRVPVTRLGYDMHALLIAFIEELESQRDGHAPRTHVIPAVFEDELPTEMK